MKRSHKRIWLSLAATLPPLASLILCAFAPRASAQMPQDNRQLRRDSAKQVKAVSQRRIALVIGNGAYQNASRLANPVNDATDMAAALQEIGFELVGGHAHVNLNADQMKRLIVDFGDMLNSGGVGLFYYAGHGVQAQGHNYLIPVEANLLKEKTLEFDAVDVNRVLAQMDAAGNGFNIVILDACRNNPFSRSWRDASQGLAQVNAPEGTLIAYATSPGKVAGDGTTRNGAYTAELLRQMRLPGVAIEEMFKQVRAGVREATKDQQTPWESSSLVGKFCFGGGCDKANAANATGDTNSSATSKVDPVAIELSYWDSIKNSNDIEDFRDYLSKYPAGQFAGLARRRVVALVPNPLIVFVGQEDILGEAKNWTRYKLAVTNRAVYPDELFTASPNLPPCGKNPKSARTWVDIFEGTGKRIYGFCALTSAEDLNNIWFQLPQGQAPPSSVYIVLTDRLTNAIHKSNLTPVAVGK